MQVTKWDFQIKGTCTSLAQLSFVLKVPLCNLHPSAINSVPCDCKSYLALDIYLGSCSEKNLDNVNMIVFTGPVKRSHDQLESSKKKHLSPIKCIEHSYISLSIVTVLV